MPHSGLGRAEGGLHCRGRVFDCAAAVAEKLLCKGAAADEGTVQALMATLQDLQLEAEQQAKVHPTDGPCPYLRCPRLVSQHTHGQPPQHHPDQEGPAHSPAAGLMAALTHFRHTKRQPSLTPRNQDALLPCNSLLLMAGLEGAPEKLQITYASADPCAGGVPGGFHAAEGARGARGPAAARGVLGQGAPAQEHTPHLGGQRSPKGGSARPRCPGGPCAALHHDIQARPAPALYHAISARPKLVTGVCMHSIYSLQPGGL